MHYLLWNNGAPPCNFQRQDSKKYIGLKNWLLNFCYNYHKLMWNLYLLLFRPNASVDYMICLPAHGAVIGAWFGAWPMPLDWERPWQVIFLPLLTAIFCLKWSILVSFLTNFSVGFWDQAVFSNIFVEHFEN